MIASFVKTGSEGYTALLSGFQSFSSAGRSLQRRKVHEFNHVRSVVGGTVTIQRTWVEYALRASTGSFVLSGLIRGRTVLEGGGWPGQGIFLFALTAGRLLDNRRFVLTFIVSSSFL